MWKKSLSGDRSMSHFSCPLLAWPEMIKRNAANPPSSSTAFIQGLGLRLLLVSGDGEEIAKAEAET